MDTHLNACPREFGSLVNLNQHLNSGVHFTTKEFGCKKCSFAATWLSGVIAHIESEKCGFMRRSQVRGLASPFVALCIGNCASVTEENAGYGSGSNRLSNVYM